MCLFGDGQLVCTLAFAAGWIIIVSLAVRIWGQNGWWVLLTMPAVAVAWLLSVVMIGFWAPMCGECCWRPVTPAPEIAVGAPEAPAPVVRVAS